MATYRTTLSREHVARILEYDPETGIFRWRYRSERAKRWNTRYAGQQAGQISQGYRYIQVDGKGGAYYASRLAWLLIHGEWPVSQLDHINGNRADDRIANLRPVTNAENSWNRQAQSNNKDGARGLSIHHTAGWRVRLMAHGVNHDLGYFRDRDEAIAARKALEERLHCEYAAQQNTEHGTYPPKRKRA